MAFSYRQLGWHSDDVASIDLNGTTLTITFNDGSTTTTTITPSKIGALSSVPIASANSVGGIKVGNYLTISDDGTLSVTDGSHYTLPVATSSTLGGIKVGTNLSVTSDGTLSATYTLPSNAVTTDTEQTITGAKLFSSSDGVTIRKSGSSTYVNLTDNGIQYNADSKLYGIAFPAESGTIALIEDLGTPLPDYSGSVAGQVLTSNGADTAPTWQTTGGGSGYILPAATNDTLGGIKVGDNLSITSEGVLSADATALPVATADVLGGVKIGENLSITDDGVLSAESVDVSFPKISLDFNSSTVATLTEAQALMLNTYDNFYADFQNVVNADGGTTHLTANFSRRDTTSFENISYGDGDYIPDIYTLTFTDTTATMSAHIPVFVGSSIFSNITTDKQLSIGSNLSVDSAGVLSATGGTEYTLPTASSSTLGGIKVGDNLTIDSNGVLSATGGGSEYTLPAATTTTLGGIKVGDNLTVTTDGTLSANTTSYTLPVANAETLGGVSPIAKTDEMTQAVGVDSTGRLYTVPGEEGTITASTVIQYLDTAPEPTATSPCLFCIPES